jgi:5' nucleotidase, deoxy (Pyrimidine), cytosolic type C protein (NT5C)
MKDLFLKGVIIGVDLGGVCADFYGRMREVTAEWFERRVRMGEFLDGRVGTIIGGFRLSFIPSHCGSRFRSHLGL